MIQYEISLVKSEKLRYSEFYQAGAELSLYAIEIKGPKYREYIWRDAGEWVLADEFYKPNDIAREICKAGLFTQMPESVKDLKFLLTQRFWTFIPGEFPKYGGVPPEDLLEVLSWDNDFLLVGTKLENIEVISRDEWDSLLTRERSWLE